MNAPKLEFSCKNVFLQLICIFKPNFYKTDKRYNFNYFKNFVWFEKKYKKIQQNLDIPILILEKTPKETVITKAPYQISNFYLKDLRRNPIEKEGAVLGGFGRVFKRF